jgi:hypothetical protein
MLPIRFEKLNDGGRCAPGCHAPYEYDRVEPVTHERPDQPAIWPREEGARAAPTAPGDMP